MLAQQVLAVRVQHHTLLKYLLVAIQVGQEEVSNHWVQFDA